MENQDKYDIIRNIVCGYFNIFHIDLKNRERDIVQTRQVVMYFSRIYTTFSLAEIGERTGGKIHATVLYSDREIKNRLSVDKTLQKQIKNIEKKIKKIITGWTDQDQRISNISKYLENIDDEIVITIKKDGYIEVYYTDLSYIRYGQKN